MRALRLSLVAALSCGALLVLASPAVASVPSVSKACKSYKTLQKDLAKVDPSDSEAFDQEAFEDVGNAFHKAAKKAPRQVKSAMNTLGDFYEDLGDADNAADALQTYGRNGAKFTKAITTYSTFYTTSCLS